MSYIPELKEWSYDRLAIRIQRHAGSSNRSDGSGVRVRKSNPDNPKGVSRRGKTYASRIAYLVETV